MVKLSYLLHLKQYLKYHIEFVEPSWSVDIDRGVNIIEISEY